MFATISDYIRWLAIAPEGTRLDAKAVCDQLNELIDHAVQTPIVPVSHESTARERFCSAPEEMRMNTCELMQALGKKKSWIYRHTSVRSGLPQIPHRKEPGGELVFIVGEVRPWIQEQEIVVVPADAGRGSRTRRVA